MSDNKSLIFVYCIIHICVIFVYNLAIRYVSTQQESCSDNLFVPYGGMSCVRFSFRIANSITVFVANLANSEESFRHGVKEDYLVYSV